jgi:pimeloyl-ACP methyl ester carboxylesterase
MSTSGAGSYAKVNGLDLYHEVHGSGRPLVLLHGGLQTIDLSFGSLIPTLEQRHQVIAVELQGHGHTADIDRDFSLDALADDIAGLLDHLAIQKVDILGFSLGGMVALQFALRHPTRLDRLVLAAVDHQPGHDEATRPQDPDMAQRMPTKDDFQAMRDAYAATAPDPGHFDEFAARASGMVHASTGWSDEELASITAPTLVLVGDLDFTPLPHAVALKELLPNGHLAVLADTTHIQVMQRADEVLPLLHRFLNA